mmetsp:Transcript_12988/g.30335  ORF Transcript_12988/g.30335 Transcript_12988/m.30335 type:complete len:476 (-) Transcript_12988:114-1541(-)
MDSRLTRSGCRMWCMQLLVALMFLEGTSGFIETKLPGARILRPVAIHYRADVRLGQGTTESAEEYQDAYGRTIHQDGDAEPSSDDDPLLAWSETTTDDSVNLDPLVVCGPSGVGKGTVIESLRSRFPSDVFGFSVSHTTRQPRPGEIHGQHYYFTTSEEIQQEIDNGRFVEHAVVHGNYYGTSKESIAALQRENKITILDIDVQGVMSVKKSGVSARYVFISPPSMEELESRLRGRGTETEEAILKRLGNAAKEIEYGEERGNFDHVFVNHDLEKTVDEMEAILSEWFPQLKKFKDAPDSTEEVETSQNDEGTKKSESPPEQKEPWNLMKQSDRMISQPSVPKPEFGTPKLKRFRESSSSTCTEKAESSQQNDASKKKQNKKQPPPPPEPEPWDFLEESDKMMRFSSVRAGHDSLEVSNRSSAQPMQKPEKHVTKYGPYTVDNEEPDWPHPSSYRDFGETNPNIVLDAKEDEQVV